MDKIVPLVDFSAIDFLSFWAPGHDFHHFFLVVPISCLTSIHVDGAGMSARRKGIEILDFWIWCVVGVVVNLPLALSA